MHGFAQCNHFGGFIVSFLQSQIPTQCPVGEKLISLNGAHMMRYVGKLEQKCRCFLPHGQNFLNFITYTLSSSSCLCLSLAVQSALWCCSALLSESRGIWAGMKLLRVARLIETLALVWKNRCGLNGEFATWNSSPTPPQLETSTWCSLTIF